MGRGPERRDEEDGGRAAVRLLRVEHRVGPGLAEADVRQHEQRRQHVPEAAVAEARPVLGGDPRAGVAARAPVRVRHEIAVAAGPGGAPRRDRVVAAPAADVRDLEPDRELRPALRRAVRGETLRDGRRAPELHRRERRREERARDDRDDVAHRPERAQQHRDRPREPRHACGRWCSTRPPLSRCPLRIRRVERSSSFAGILAVHRPQRPEHAERLEEDEVRQVPVR